MTKASPLPRSVALCFVIYTFASLTHFVHNAEYIAFYPNMPTWITRDTVYCAWLAIAGVGALGLALARFGFRMSAFVALAVYGSLGLDGLAHYTLALCSQHTLSANLTIWFEVVAGSVLACVALGYMLRGLRNAAMSGA